MKKGQADTILGEIVNGHRGRRSQSYHLAQIHVQLLSVIQKDIGEEYVISYFVKFFFTTLASCRDKIMMIL